MKRSVALPIQIFLAMLFFLLAAGVGAVASRYLPIPNFLPVPNTSPEAIVQPSPTVLPSPTAPASALTPVAPATPVPVPPTATLPPAAALEGLRRQGALLFAMSDGAHSHLFAYHPQFLPLTRLTQSAWDDIQPSVSPDGLRVAFASRQNGYWDLFILDLATGKQTRLTDSPDYDGTPTWSPDGQFIAYESYTDKGTQIFIRNLADPAQPPVQLTNAPGQNFSPAWSPQGREIAFISTRSGQEDVWLARLDRIDDRFINISPGGSGRDRAPRWSPDGNQLTWATDQAGTSLVLLWDRLNPEKLPKELGSGNMPVWGPGGDAVLAQVPSANQVALIVYRTADGSLVYPPSPLPGQIQGVDWRSGPFPELVITFPTAPNAQKAAMPLYQPAFSVQTGLQKNRFAVVPLKDVAAPYPYLHDAADEAFQALRQHLSHEIGWDFLGQLEQAYQPITTPALPGQQENWLYTGRAFAVNPVPLSAGWLALMREEFGGQTYWRVFIRCLYQDASQGRPLPQRTWDLNARYRGDPRTYDQGGEYGAIPEGYWVDFTELASRYGWERLPAQTNWRTYYPATLFGTFVYRDGLTWAAAIGQLYPGEAVATPTRWVTLTSTLTPTPTLYYQRLITPSITPSVTLTATRRPTLTPPAPAP